MLINSKLLTPSYKEAKLGTGVRKNDPWVKKTIPIGILKSVCNSGSQPGAILPFRGHLAMSRDNFGCHARIGGCYQHLEGRSHVSFVTLTWQATRCHSHSILTVTQTSPAWCKGIYTSRRGSLLATIVGSLVGDDFGRGRRETESQIYYKELAHVIMDADKFQGP